MPGPPSFLAQVTGDPRRGRRTARIVAWTPTRSTLPVSRPAISCRERTPSRHQWPRRSRSAASASVEVRAHLDGLAGVLYDCVAGGASVSYMAPFTHEQARGAFEAFAAEVEQGGRLFLAAFPTASGRHGPGGPRLPPNQPHRAEIAKLLVHRSARRQGIAAASHGARRDGGGGGGQDAPRAGHRDRRRAERLYARLGWTRVGVIPGYALYPDGRPCATTVFWKRVGLSAA